MIKLYDRIIEKTFIYFKKYDAMEKAEKEVFAYNGGYHNRYFKKSNEIIYWKFDDDRNIIIDRRVLQDEKK